MGRASRDLSGAAVEPLPGPQISRAEGVQVGLLFAVLGIVTVAGFYLSFRLGQQYLVLAPLGLIAYILGLRHGFDADHIAAIDNTTRKLLNDGRRPLTVGTWFSLGHSTIVAGLVVALIAVTNFVQAHVAQIRAIGHVLGTVISGVFLGVIGVVNLVIAAAVYALFQRAKQGHISEAEYEDQMNRRGLLYRYFYRLFRVVKEPWQVYPIGVLFGLGFDTATEVALIVIVVGVGTAGGVPVWTALVLPLLFTCGMVLSDTSDGVAMRYAYGWAFNNPIRKIFYNLTLTVISVIVAFFVAGFELLQVLGSELGLGGPFWNGLERVDFGTLGLGIVVLFLAAFGVAMVIYRLKGYGQLGAPAGPRVPPPEGGPDLGTAGP
jgi:nickel/cobalt transporter (NiCoT) family protein